jgi:hypothetical protein
LVARKPFWNGPVARKFCRSVVALPKQASLKDLLLIDDWMVAWGHSRIAKDSHQNASGQLSPLPTAIGTRPFAFSLASSDSSAAMVVGGAVMPACWNRSLRYQMPTACRS